MRSMSAVILTPGDPPRTPVVVQAPSPIRCRSEYRPPSLCEIEYEEGPLNGKAETEGYRLGPPRNSRTFCLTGSRAGPSVKAANILALTPKKKRRQFPNG